MLIITFLSLMSDWAENSSCLTWRFRRTRLTQECSCLLSENKARPLCVCWVSRWISASAPPYMNMHTHTHTHTHIQQIYILWLCACVFVQVLDSDRLVLQKMKKAAKAKYTSGHGTHRYTHTRTQTETHVTSCTNMASLCQIMWLTWSSTSVRWRSCQSTVIQTERQRLAPPSAGWQTFLKNSSLPWRTWWVNSVMSQRSEVTAPAPGNSHDFRSIWGNLF